MPQTTANVVHSTCYSCLQYEPSSQVPGIGNCSEYGERVRGSDLVCSVETARLEDERGTGRYGDNVSIRLAADTDEGGVPFVSDNGYHDYQWDSSDTEF